MATVATTSPPSAFRKTTETFTAGARTLPQRYFISPEVFAEEQRKIFAREWICVGHQSQIARAGDYFVREVAGESLIILRDKGEEIAGVLQCLPSSRNAFVRGGERTWRGDSMSLSCLDLWA